MKSKGAAKSFQPSIIPMEVMNHKFRNSLLSWFRADFLDETERMYSLYLMLNEETQCKVYERYVKEMMVERSFEFLGSVGGKLMDDSDYEIDFQYERCHLPLHQMAIEVIHEERDWKQIELLIDNMPECIAHTALTARDGIFKKTVFHYAIEGEAPSSATELMLRKAPEAASITHKRCSFRRPPSAIDVRTELEL